jgi:hypothetical protein
MQISSGTVALSGSSTRLFQQERRERLEMWVGQRPARTEGPPADGGLGKLLEQAAKARKPVENEEKLDPELEKLLLILEKVFGAKGARRFAMRMQALQAQRAAAEAQVRDPAAGGAQRAGWGVSYELDERTVETQSSRLKASGEVTLEDGRQLSFTLDWSQSSIRIEQRSVRLALGDAALKDPLVLDLDGDGIRFSGELARFDVDQDGRMDAVARPAGADRIVALDGAVLGARSGEAFRDLARLDDDGNGWIDAGDAAFGRLQLWDGRGFSALANSGVAALATTSVALPFAYRDADGALQAQGRRGGVFLATDGRPGAVAQVDLVA